jgi:3D (Asp-Asp-Asp) domain-containing protein
MLLLICVSVAIPSLTEDITYSVIPSLQYSHAKERLVVVRALVTAYSNDKNSINVSKWRDGFTASMTRAEIGTIAADLRHYQFGTDVYIPEYGFGKVLDTGGKIKGRKRFDIFKETENEALEWGAVKCNVLIFIPLEEQISF